MQRARDWDLETSEREARGERASGGFSRKRRLDPERRPGEVARAVARAKQGDQTAIRYLYLRYADNVYGYARSIVQDEHDAEDVVQQVFTRLITAIAGYQARGVPFSAWLLRIAHNVAVDHLRRRGPRRDHEDDKALLTSRSAPARNDDLSLAIREALAQVPPIQREVVVLRHVGGYSPGEIARHLGRTEDSVHGLHHRGRRALQTALVRAGAAPTPA